MVCSSIGETQMTNKIRNRDTVLEISTWLTGSKEKTQHRLGSYLLYSMMWYEKYKQYYSLCMFYCTSEHA